MDRKTSSPERDVPLRGGIPSLQEQRCLHGSVLYKSSKSDKIRVAHLALITNLQLSILDPPTLEPGLEAALPRGAASGRTQETRASALSFRPDQAFAQSNTSFCSPSILAPRPAAWILLSFVSMTILQPHSVHL